MSWSVPARAAARLATAAIVLVLAAGPSASITNGEPDNGRHPYVGHMAADFVGATGALYGQGEPRDGVLDVGCSLSLVAPRLALTAAHCVAFLQFFDPDALDKPIAVSFAERWSTSVPLVYGRMHVSPYVGTGDHAADDLAAIVLDEPVGIRPARLPAPGELDRRQADGSLGGRLVDTVGYGSREPRVGAGGRGFDFPVLPGVREVGTGAVAALTPRHLVTNQNAEQGYGGSCIGDSGAPVLDGDTVLAVVSTGDRMCRANSFNVRLDTPTAQTFLADMLSLAGAAAQ